MQTQSKLLSKPHYEILDGLRGVAALIVVAFHLFEIHGTASGNVFLFPVINHGYLAVDFFFLLSGFVIAYAYDDRWGKGKMSVGNFFKRRVIRLQPMVILGSIIGAVCFYFGAGEQFPLISQTTIWMLLLVMVIGCFLLPIPPAMDVRVWTEMFPLNGPAWSLFYEYIANILYGLFVRKFSKLLLTILVVISGLTLMRLAVFGASGSVIGGHILDVDNLTIGLTRLIYPFFCGVLLFRIGKLVKVKAGFWFCSLLLVIMLAFPRLGGDAVWINGLYESVCILLVFPLIVLMGAGSSIKGRYSVKICDFLGKISYPVYIIHYPIIYIYMAYVTDNGLTWYDTWPLMIALWLGCIGLAYGALRLFDEPVRNWLKRRFLDAK